MDNQKNEWIITLPAENPINIKWQITMDNGRIIIEKINTQWSHSTTDEQEDS